MPQAGQITPIACPEGIGKFSCHFGNIFQVLLKGLPFRWGSSFLAVGVINN